MRKTLIGMLMGATMATPLAARPQNANEEGTVTPVRTERVQREPRAERRQERTEQRAEQRVERRQERTEQRIERRQERAEQPRTNAAVPRTPDRARNWPGQTERVREGLAGNDRREDRADRRDDRRDNRRDWNRNWRNDNRYDWQRYRYANRGIFSPGRYYSPYSNYGYSRFSIGLRLGSGYYSNRYWINDPWAYRLPPAYAGTRWIRYYNDVLLVDMYSGEVIDVIYDFFW